MKTLFLCAILVVLMLTLGRCEDQEDTYDDGILPAPSDSKNPLQAKRKLKNESANGRMCRPGFWCR